MQIKCALELVQKKITNAKDMKLQEVCQGSRVDKNNLLCL